MRKMGKLVEARVMPELTQDDMRDLHEWAKRAKSVVSALLGVPEKAVPDYHVFNLDSFKGRGIETTQRDNRHDVFCTMHPSVICDYFATSWLNDPDLRKQLIANGDGRDIDKYLLIEAGKDLIVEDILDHLERSGHMEPMNSTRRAYKSLGVRMLTFVEEHKCKDCR